MKAFENSDLLHAVNAVKRGEVILYPTDTIWGIGCHAMNDDAIMRIYDIKGRSHGKKLIILVSDIAMLQKHTGPLPEKVLEKVLNPECPTTIIYPKAKGISELLFSNTGSVAIRLTKDPFCCKLISATNNPVTSTSANFSGDKPPSCFVEISLKILTSVDYIVKYRQEDKTPALPSKILLLQNSDWVEIRS